jgi:hypothetical protein
MNDKKKGKLRLRLYWFLNEKAISWICLAVMWWSFLFPRYLPLRIVVPSGLVCAAGSHIYRNRFFKRMGWDKERIPWKTIKMFWRLIFIILLLLALLLSEIGILE